MMEQEYKYMVCTRCFTFNHAPYIVDAMNGFTMQETTFPVITLIVDDASQDGEPDVIRQYLVENFQAPYSTEETDDYYLICANHTTNPNCTFVVFLLKYNHYSIRKSKMPYLSKWSDNAKYTALCEGDDYWIDPYKLQKQVEYLEKHQECGLVHARAKIYNQDKQSFVGLCGENEERFESIITVNPIVTLTACYRTKLFLEYQGLKQQWDTRDWKMGDYPMWIWMSYYSKVFFMNEEVGVYRVLKSSASHGSLETRLLFLANTASIQTFFVELFKLPKEIKETIDYKCIQESANACMKVHQKRKAFSYIKRLNFKDKIWLLRSIALDAFK